MGILKERIDSCAHCFTFFRKFDCSRKLGYGLGRVKNCAFNQKTSQQSVHPTAWESARFRSIFLALSLDCPQAESTPAHLRVTLAVSQPKSKTKYVFVS
jgi:hypothetical protein